MSPGWSAWACTRHVPLYPTSPEKVIYQKTHRCVYFEDLSFVMLPTLSAGLI